MKINHCLRNPVFVSLVVALLAGCATAWSIEPGGIREKFGRYVFTVNAYSRTGSGDAADDDKDARWRVSIGAAYPADDKGCLLTLTNILRGAERIEVIDASGVRYPASVVGRDDAGAISVLRIERDGGLFAAPIRPARTVRAGTKVVFLGMPAGGAIAAVPGRVDAMYGRDGVMIVTVSGEPGTSGTPVFDANGTAVGLLAYHLEKKSDRKSGRNSYLVFPMEYATAAARSIINRAEARSGWLGIEASVGDLTVENVVPGSPAAKCGICPGDRITEFNGVPVHTSGDLVRETGETRAGDTVKVKVIRDDEPVTVTPRLERHPPERKRR